MTTTSRLEYLAARGDVDARRALDRLRPRADPSAILINPDLEAWSMSDGDGSGFGNGDGDGHGYPFPGALSQ